MNARNVAKRNKLKKRESFCELKTLENINALENVEKQRRNKHSEEMLKKGKKTYKSSHKL
jgi:hypothetical protein